MTKHFYSSDSTTISSSRIYSRQSHSSIALTTNFPATFTALQNGVDRLHQQLVQELQEGHRHGGGMAPSYC